MTIGTVDYVSTAPWNDPTNPWPAYAQVSLSAADINPVILTLESFYPDVKSVLYANYDATTVSLLMYDDTVEFTPWMIQNDGNDYYKCDTITRAIPAGYLQGNTNWQPIDGAFENTLSIIPVTTSLNPWEYRRRRLLEIC